MGDSNMTKLTASLEELSLKKQLPLRQNAQKPVLKYNQPIAKPMQFHSQTSDVVPVRPETWNTYNSHSQAPTTHTMGSASYRLSRHHSATPVTDDRASIGGTPFGSYLGGQTYISPNNIGKPPTPSPSKGHSNPYARPLSAKDIVNDLQGQQKSAKKNSSHMSANGTHSNSTTVAFPINSFMRPQSAVRKEPVPSQKTKEVVLKDQMVNKGQANKPEANSSNTYSGVSQDRPVSTSNSPIQKTTTTTLTTSTGQGGLLSTTTVTTTRQGATIIQKTSPPSNHGTQVNSIISKVTDGKILQTTQTTHKTVNRPISSIPKPGGSASSSSATSCSSTGSINSENVPKPTTPEMQKVRNLNYTPTKPYTEVSDPSNLPPQPIVKEKPLSSTSVPSRTMLPLQTTITVASFPDKKSAKDEIIAKTISSSKSNTATSTIYYSKGSKSEIILHEQRPPVVGALSRDRTGSEKSGLMDGEEGDEESEYSAPGERLPGDGEASVDEFGEDEEDGIDCLEDDYVAGSDGESDGYSITSSLSRQSSAKSRAKSARRPASRSVSSASDDTRPRTAKATSTQTVSTDVIVRPPLTPSLFPRIPPTVNFVVEGEKVETLPWDIRKLLKWRMSPITPNVVKHTLARSGFRITKRSHDWLGCWGKHMKSQGFKAIKEYQKLNHFPGSFQIGRKDRLWRNLSKMQVHFGKKEFGFFPQTFVLPYDTKLLKRAWEDGGNKQKWIIKPPASARGIGIKVISKWTQIPRKRAVIVQRYLGRPYLINDSKFDMRIYVYVSSYDPLRLYIFEDGLARFASCKYSSSMKNLNNKFMHLTNYSINKKNTDYQANGDEKLCQGHKWGLKALWNYMKRQGVNTAAIWDSIKDLVIKTIICADSPVNSMIKANCRSRYCVHELFGFDILLDENLKPWILEVNISPSLHSNSQLDINIKGQMIRDLFNIAGFRIPDKADVSHSSSTSSSATDFSSYVPPNDYCLDKRLFTQVLSADERSKHAYYCQRHQDEQLAQTVLDTLTPDDVRILTDSIDEDSRKGCFQRIFPTPSTHKYLKYFESPRYYNLLLNQWVLRYNRMEQKGISLLELYCEEGIQLENPTEKAHHQWSPPTSSLNSYREPRLQSAPLEKHTYTRVPLHIKSSSSSSQLPKMSKKPGATKTSGPQPVTRGTSQSSVGSSCISPSDSVPQSPAPSYTKSTAVKAR